MELGKPTQLWNYISNWLSKSSGAYLTDAELEANKFSAEQANLAFQRELEASNTAHQRKVQDLQLAGLNPMMAVSSGVSLPSASAAASVSPSAAAFNLPSISNLAMLPLQMRSMKADISLKKAEEKLKLSEAEKTGAETTEIGYRVENLKKVIAGVDLDNQSKSIINKYLDRQQEAGLAMTEANTDYYTGLVRSLDKSIEKMDYEELEILVRCCDLKEHINYLIAQENLTKSQVAELSANIKKLNQETRLIGLNADNFDEITVVGSKSLGVKAGPFSTNESEPITLSQIKANAEKRKEEISSKGKKSRKSLYEEFNGQAIYD